MFKHISKIATSLMIVGMSVLGMTGIASAYDPMPPVLFPPFLGVVTPVPSSTHDTTPDFTFSSSEAGTITYEGDCVSLTTHANDGETKVTFMPLSYGTHNNCRIQVTGETTNLASAWLNVPAFTVVNQMIIPVLPPLPDFAPFLSVVTPVSNPTFDTTPDFTFKSNEAGTISYSGDCSSTTTNAVADKNTITFKQLGIGTHSNCKLAVTDTNGNKSSDLTVPSFEIRTSPVIPPLDPAKCAGFTDVTVFDTDCAAFSYVKSIGAMTGNPDGTFAPSGLLQRDQIAKIALETFNKYSQSTNYCGGVNPFPDVTNASWSYQYVCRAKNLGVVTGYLAGADAGFFRPARSVNRAEFLALILRNLNESMPTGSSYTDVDQSTWYGNYARFSKLNNLFAGNYLYPENYTTRREVAQILYKLHNLGKI